MKIAHSVQRLLLPGAAVFAMLWVIVRAHVQAVIGDEAMTYSNWVGLLWPSEWTPHANNHVLNSTLMRLFTSVFGVSNLTVRSGALIGAASYIFVAYRFSKLIAEDIALQLSLFLCLVYNPFVFDFMVAARGYGLATAFLACAIWIVATPAAANSLLVAGSLCSVFAALSFVSNFSFAFVDAAGVSMLYLWTCRSAAAREPSGARRVTLYAKFAVVFTLPGLAVTAVLAGWTVLHWPKGQLVYGGESLRQTFSTIAEASLYEPNPYLVNPLFYDSVNRLSRFVFPLLSVMCVWRIVTLLIARSRPRSDQATWLLRFGAVVIGIITLTLSAHWLAFRLFRILLPYDRTAIYLVPLITLLVGILAAVRFSSNACNWSRRGLVAMMFVLGVYYILCLRVSYFKEWRFDSDVNKVYSVLAFYNHTCGLKDIFPNWRYDASLNFYRTMSGSETIYRFPDSREYPAHKPAYVLYYPEDGQFITQKGLMVVYRGESGATVAIDPAAGCETELPEHGIRWGR